MKKRILALMISAILVISLLPYEVFANLQSPVEGISSNSIVGHTNELNKMRPRVELMFAEPIPSSLPDTSASVTGGDGEAIHGVSDYYYQVDIQEYPTGLRFKSPESPRKLEGLDIPAGGTLTSGIKVQGLSNGRLYRMSVIPYHYHRYDRGREEGPLLEWAPRTPVVAPYIYVLTDFDTQIEGKGGSIEVTWEDSGYPDMEYEIGYIQGNYEGQSLEAIRGNNAGNNIQYIAPADIKNNATQYRDPQTGRTRFRYVIENNIATGQMYSAYVVSKTDKIENRDILKNRETPKVVTATTEIGLNVYSAGKDKIRLEWDAQLIYAMDGEYKLQQTQIKEYRAGQESGRVIATLYGKEGADIGYYEYREPRESSHYELVFIYKHDNGQTLDPLPKTGKVLYVPGQLRTKPATPQIPKAVGPNTKITKDNRADYLVPGDKLTDVSDLDFWKNSHTFHANLTKPPTLNFVWSAYKEDLSLLYDLWVTDDIDIATSDAVPIIKDLSFNNEQNAEGILYNQEKEEVVGFRHTLSEYYDSDMVKRPLLPNKVYYVKIVAKKQYGDELEPSLPAIVTIIFDADGEIFTPPTISKPPLMLDSQNIGATSVTLAWLETWHEIMAKYPASYPDEKEQKKAKEWNAKVYTTGPSISFIKTDGATEHVLKSQQNMNAIKNIVGIKTYLDNYIDRTVRLGKNVQYAYKHVPYLEVLKALEAYNATTQNKKTIEEYIEQMMRDENDPAQTYGWQKISPQTAEDKDYIQWKQHTQRNLKPNTSYIFFIKPYTQDHDGTKLQASLPTWIIGTTLPDGDMPEGKPTVPVLSLNKKGDTQISVQWPYNSAFDYEIRYSKLEDPEQATVWPFEISTEIGDPTYVENGGEAVVTIDGLFPETTYNIWIRAKQKKGNDLSAWSNPVTATTNALEAPTSPGGLGVASYQSILEAGKDFKPVERNHITVEWQRNAVDKDLDDLAQDNQRVAKAYKYVIEIADNPEFIDKQSVTVSQTTVGTQVGNAQVLTRSMVYFGELVANRPYYIRAKTILTATDTETNKEIVKSSDYTQAIRIITKPSQEEYDGGDKVNQVIYPDKIEETYDGTTWTYQILDTQKVINEMVTGDQFRYVVPVEKYRGLYDAKYRVIRLPQPLVTTLLKRRMELEIRTNILSIQIPAGALEAYMVGASADGMVEFVFERLDASDLYKMGSGYEYGFLSIPEKMSISIKGQKGIVPITKVDALLKLKINMPYQGDYSNRNLGGYTYDSLGGSWKKGNHTYDKINRQVAYTSGAVGTYAVYEKTRVPAAGDLMSPAMTTVSKKHDIVGLGTKYTPYMPVSTSEYINIMLGIAENKAQIKPDALYTPQELNRARNAGLYTGQPSGPLTQEAAISGAVRLYELTHGISVRVQTNANVSAAGAQYQDNLKKAYTIGLIYDLNPKQPVTYEELFNLIEQVME